MAYQSPFFEGTQAQGIINNYLNNMPGGLPPYTTPSTNPYLVDSTPFVPPAAQPTPDPTVPNCEELYPGEGRVYDPVLQACVIAEVAPENTGDNDRPEEMDRDQMMYNQMLKDSSTPFGASNILDDYLIDSRGGDNTFLRFDPEVNRLGAGLPLGFNILGQFADSLTGGANRRQNTFDAATKTLADLGYGQQLNNGTFQVYNPQQYFNTVKDNSAGFGTNMNINQAVDSVMNPQPQVYDPLTGSDRSSNANASSGSPIAEDLSGGLLYTRPLTSVDSSGNRTRNDNNYRAEVARNIERNKRNNPYGVSGFKQGVGFTRGR
jgi:hypothetical protein